MKVNCGHGQAGDGKIQQEHPRNHELKLTGMDEFNSDDHYIYYTAKNLLEDIV